MREQLARLWFLAIERLLVRMAFPNLTRQERRWVRDVFREAAVESARYATERTRREAEALAACERYS